jgi:D-alanyl-D-alanine carboxypeptidase (penicillin-binding protein 5/6)
VRLLALVAVLAAGAAGLLAAGVLSLASESGGASRPAAEAVERLPPPLPREASQDAVGPLPEPAGASRVDLARPSLMSYLHLRRGPKAGLAFDLGDGTVLWRLRATAVRPIASLTKLMTALLAVERLGPRERVRIARAADQVGGARMGGLRPGRRVRADVLLKGLLISSANDAAVALAVAGAGSERAWVQLMNKRAGLLGLRCTHYVDAHGLDPRNRSCAADLAVLAMRAMNEPRIAEIARKRYARVWPGAGKKLTLRTTNQLLRDQYPGAVGLKTGYTSPAGFCLVAVVQRGERRIGIVVLGSKDSFADARRVAREAARTGALPAAT